MRFTVDNLADSPEISGDQDYIRQIVGFQKIANQLALNIPSFESVYSDPSNTWDTAKFIGPRIDISVKRDCVHFPVRVLALTCSGHSSMWPPNPVGSEAE